MASGRLAQDRRAEKAMAQGCGPRFQLKVPAPQGLAQGLAEGSGSSFCVKAFLHAQKEVPAQGSGSRLWLSVLAQGSGSIAFWL